MNELSYYCPIHHALFYGHCGLCEKESIGYHKLHKPVKSILFEPVELKGVIPVGSKQRHKWADVIIAWANGETIESRHFMTGDWTIENSNPNFDAINREWRIKPAECWIAIHKNGVVHPHTYKNKALAMQGVGADGYNFTFHKIDVDNPA